MTWFKVDDKLHDHRKARMAGKAAMGVWVLAGSWSMDNLTDGFIPDSVLTRWGTPSDARRLVEAGLWSKARVKGENGHQFHDWSRFQPSAAVTAATRAAEAEAGVRGNHQRWHVKRRVSDPNCEYCYRVPDQEPDGVPDPLPESGAISGQGDSPPIRPVPVPVKRVASKDAPLSSDLAKLESDPPREDVERLCQHLLKRLKENDIKPEPTITKGWRTAARHLLDRDGRAEAEVHQAIDWATNDSVFWAKNIRSMEKLRKHYDAMREDARDVNRGKLRGGGTVNHHAHRLAEEGLAFIQEQSAMRAVGGAS